MPQDLALVTYLVRDYDEAIAWFRTCLNFQLVEDTPLGATKRWVVVKSSDTAAVGLLLAKADGQAQTSQIGKAAGGRVAFFFHTDDFATTHALMSAKGVTFLERPRDEDYGTVAVFTDLYGNRWDLIQPGTTI